MTNQNESPICCPKCGSTQLYVGKKGFSTGQAVLGKVLTGSNWGAIAAGSIGQDKIRITCLKCGCEFAPGESGKPIIQFDNKARPLDHTELPETHYYRCECGKEAHLPGNRPLCPKCGRPLSEKNIFTPEYKSGGCMSMIAILIAMSGTLCLILLIVI